MYFHILENCQRDGKSVYVHTRTYKSFKHLLNHLLKEGKPIWIVESALDYLPSTDTIGNFTASYWNTGGFGFTTMPVLPLERR